MRNGWYTENYTASISGTVEAGALIGSAEEGKISSAPRSDYAEAAAVVLSNKGHEVKVYELAGDTSFTLKELAKEISQQTGKDIPYQNLSETEYTKALKDMGLPEGIATAIAGWDVNAAAGELFDDGKELSKLIGRQTIGLSEIVKDALRSKILV